ncbi:MAG TPA: T9SS type A sorting domain-containing protein, partial [Saprospiraceae bacterium]|nr:T9SS type A sorting domain-containing protein [Saprospiraceae bacterium]
NKLFVAGGLSATGNASPVVDILMDNTVATKPSRLPNKILHLYPNPVREQLHLQWHIAPTPVALHIYDSAGQLHYASNYPQLPAVLPVGDLPKGLYQLQVRSALGTTIHSFIKH